MAVHVWGLLGLLVFYGIVLAVGIWAGSKQRDHGEEEVMLAGRRIGLVFGLLTLMATWLGGAYINATAEMMYKSGLAWCQLPIAYSLSLLVGAAVFVNPMRKACYVTMLDPFQNKYGKHITSLMFIPALLGDLFWIASILNALGGALMVILNIDKTIAIIVSTIIAAGYTMVGGFYSVAYTDVLQLAFIFLGMSLSVPFAYNHDAVSPTVMATTDWLGHINKEDLPSWIDSVLLIILGGVPSQPYFQRVLSIKSVRAAQYLSIGAMFGCLLVAIPSMIIGIIARATDWENVQGFNRTLTTDEADIVFPLVLRYLTPGWVSFFGLGAVSAVVMSSVDSCILSSSCMFTRNVYKMSIRPNASNNESLWILRVSVFVVAGLATFIALGVESVYDLSVLVADTVYVILFPQLLLVVHCPQAVNHYGCITSFVIGLLVRILGGEVKLGIPVLIQYPMYDTETGVQKFPFKTTAMLVTLIVHLIVSWATRFLFEGKYLSADRWDILGVYREKTTNKHLRQSDSKNVDVVELEPLSDIGNNVRNVSKSNETT